MIDGMTIVIGLCLFEIVSSLDNAVINAEVLRTMGERARKWFLFWGILLAVFVVRGFLPWLIVWAATPGIGFFEALFATFNGNEAAAEAVKKSGPLLMSGGGMFLFLLFIHWLFKEEKHFGLPGERLFLRYGSMFYFLATLALGGVHYFAIREHNPWLGFSATLGMSAFFLSHGFKEEAEKAELELTSGRNTKSDLAKIIYLEVIDLCFSIDGVVGAFAFTMSVPLILLGNGIGAIVVRQLTVSNIERIKRYPYLKNGAMYAIGMLGGVMLLEAFHVHIPKLFTPIATISIIGYFFAMCFWRKVPDEEGRKRLIEIMEETYEETRV